MIAVLRTSLRYPLRRPRLFVRRVPAAQEHCGYIPDQICRATNKSVLVSHAGNYTFNALIDLPMAMAIHSPWSVECPECIVMPAICGDHARLLISLGPVYAMTGSATMRFFTSGRGELRPELGFLGDVDGMLVYGLRSQSSSWQSSPVPSLSNREAAISQGRRTCRCQERARC